MFKRFVLSAITLTSIVAWATPGVPVATIGSKKISPEEFKERFEQNKQLSVPGKNPSKEEVLSNIVNFEVAVQEAKAKGIDRDPIMKDQFDILLYKTLVAKELKPKIEAIKVPETDIRDYYDKSPLLRTRQIVFLLSPEMKPDEVQKVKARAQMVSELISSGKKKFSDLVSEFSEGPDAKYGGLIDWSGRNKLVPEYYEAALALKEANKVSGVVESPYGFHIVQLEGIKPFAGIDNDYKNFITRTLREVKGRDLYETYFAGLKKKYAVKTNLEGI